LRLIDSGITQLKAQGPSRTCNESKEDGDLVGLVGDHSDEFRAALSDQRPVSAKVNLPHAIDFRDHVSLSRPTSWNPTLPSKVNLPHVINCRVLCGANLVT